MGSSRGDQDAPNTSQEQHNIALLFVVEFGNIFVGTPANINIAIESAFILVILHLFFAIPSARLTSDLD